jgi:hypothetical protein
MATEVPEKRASSMHPEDGSSIFLQNFSTFLSDYMALHLTVQEY